TMNITGIISISGKPGLSKIVKQSRNGIIVESLIDGKRFPVQGTERISSLEDISIYTYEEDVLLLDVFEKVKAYTKGAKAISHKSSNDELQTEFEKIMPNYDQDRVYTSDIKKVFQWFNLLLEKGLLEEDKGEEKAEKKETKSKTAKKPEKAKTEKKAVDKKAAKPKAKSNPKPKGGSNRKTQGK
ncbi:MAG: DUF5606 domain-containing protein, partial [Vicingaceae bacterium]